MLNWRKPLIYCLLHLSGSYIPQNLNEIKKRANDLKELKAYQSEKLRKLLLESCSNVPYYSQILGEAGVVKNNNVFLEKFSQVPYLTKDILRENFDLLKHKKLENRNWYLNTSGGSTGEPVQFIQDQLYSDWNIANKIYYKYLGGQNIGDREFRLWGNEKDILNENESLSMRLKNFLYNRREFNAFCMSQDDMLDFVSEWNKFKPSWGEAYVQSLFEVACFIEKNKLKIHRPKGVLTSAGTLYPEMRKKIESIFRCPVFNRYGSREVGDMACSDGKTDDLKLSPWNHYLEVLDGKVYVTTLNNFSMPLIRYDIGDYASLGKDFSLNSVLGREMSLFKMKNGKTIAAEFFIHFIGVVFNQSLISKFQVIQRDYDLIEIKLVCSNKDKLISQKPEIEKVFQDVLGKDCVVKWTFVSKIPPLKNGKYLYTVSEL